MPTHKVNADLDVSGEVQGTSLDINGNGDIAGNLSLSGDSRILNLAANSTTSSQSRVIIGEQGLYGVSFRWDTGAELEFDGFWNSDVTGAANRDLGQVDVNNKLWTFNDNVVVGGELEAASLDINGNADISGTLTVHGNLTANGNIIGDDSTNITNINSIGCDIIHADAESTTKFTMGASEIACLVEDTDVFQVSASDYIYDPAVKVSIKKRKFAKTSNTDANADGDIVYFGGTTSMDAGKIYYFTSGGAWALADADAESTAKGMLAVALGSASDTNGMLIRGMVTLDTDPGTIGDTLFLSTTSGVATSTAPSGNGDIVRVIGYCLDSTNGQIYFNPDGTFVEVTA